MSADHAHDNWHQHSAAEGAPQHEHGSHMTVKALGMTFVIMTVGVILTILVLVLYFNSYVGKYKAEQTEGTAMMEPAFNAKLAAQEKLSGYEWVDRDARTVRIPLEQASRSVIAQYESQNSGQNQNQDQTTSN